MDADHQALPAPPPLSGWSLIAVRAGSAAAAVSRRLGRGAGAVIGGRVSLLMDRHILTRLAKGRRIVLVSGTNGKTTTSHLMAAALRTVGAVAHNASGANMVDGVVAALAAEPRAPFAVLEVDELHLATVAAAVEPAVVVLLNLSRDQLDRGSEVRSVAAALRSALLGCIETTVVANADDPMVVWAAGPAADTVWVSVGGAWSGDAATCPNCGEVMSTGAEWWSCSCGLVRPDPTWQAADGAALTADTRLPVPLDLPGEFNVGNAVMAIAAVAELGIAPEPAAEAMSAVMTVAGRYAVVQRGAHEIRLLLAKNAAGFAETLPLLDPARSLMVVVNAQQADGLDTSWLWDVAFERIAPRAVVAAGERAADVGVRLSYADISHDTVPDPLVALSLLPPGNVDVVANYTAFDRLLNRLAVEAI
jgi:UDP-N-acetylmuramyl tripeptide synthase